MSGHRPWSEIRRPLRDEVSEERLGVKVEVEYDTSYERWFVWEIRHWGFTRKMICSGDTREGALALARQKIEKGLLAHKETLEL